MIELFDCERLLARISAATCEANRKRSGFQQIFACQGCPGLGQKSVEIMETEVMASKQGKCQVCGRKAITLPNGKECGRCYSRKRKGLDPLTGNPKIEPSVEDDAVECALCGNSGTAYDGQFCDCQYGVELERTGSTTPGHLNALSAPAGLAARLDMSGSVTVVADKPQSFGKVVNADGSSVPFGVDGLVLQAVRESWAEAEARLLPQLSGLKPSAALVRAAKIVEQLEGIGC
jgi:hypothetical protein